MTASRSALWLGIIAGAMILVMSAGIRHAFGIFLPPITTEFGWGREVFSLGFAVQMILLGFGSPLAGAVADRYGAGRVLAFGAVLQGLGLLGVALASTPGQFVLTAGVVLGLGSSAVSNVVVIGAVGRMVDGSMLSRGVGILMAGASLGQIVFLPFAHHLIQGFGWSRALLVIGALAFIALPLIVLLVRGGRREGAAPFQQPMGEALREARGHSGYLLLTTGFFVCGFHVFFLATHLPAYAQDLGLDAVVGANALMLIGIFNMLGANIWGVLGDRTSKKHMLGLIYLLRSVVIALFLAAPPTSMSVYVFSAAIGFLWLGTVPLTSGLVGQIFGAQYLSMLYGIVFLGHQVGGFLGAWMAGWLFDITGSYAIMWGLSIALGLFAAVIHLPINDKALQRTEMAGQPG